MAGGERCRGGEGLPDTLEMWRARAMAFKEIADERGAQLQALTVENPECLGHVPEGQSLTTAGVCERCRQPYPCEVRRLWILKDAAERLAEARREVLHGHMVSPCRSKLYGLDNMAAMCRYCLEYWEVADGEDEHHKPACLVGAR